MKTTIDIPDDLLNDLMSRTSAQTKREAVILAITEFNQRRRMSELTGMLGTFVDFMDRKELDSARKTN
jgi:Arc/MetJ family transcription regulator